MWKRFFFRSALAGLMLILPAAARMADAQQISKQVKPAIVLSLASYDELKSDVLYLAGLVGQDEAAAQLDRAINAQIGDGGWQGFDLKKPIVAYAWIGAHGPTDSSLVVLIPVVDQKVFLGLLEKIGTRAERLPGDDGVYRAYVEKVPDPVYLRFADGYAYVTSRDKSVLDRDRLLAPAAVLPDGQAGIVSVVLNIDRIPDELKDTAMDEFDFRLAEARAKGPPHETELQKRSRLAGMDETARAIKALVTDGAETSLRLDFDRRTGDAALALNVEGKPGSAMAATLQELGQARSVTAGMIDNGAAMSGEFNIGLSDKLRRLFVSAMDEGQKQALVTAKNAGERDVVSAVFDAVMPTFRAGELDGTFYLQGPGSDGLYAFVGGIKIREGSRLEQVFRDTAGGGPEADVKFDVDKVGSVSVHRVTPKTMDDEARRAFGDNSVYVAFRDDAVFVAAGASGFGALKEALAVAPGPGKVLDLQVSLAQLAPLAPEKEVVNIARRVFSNDKDGDRLRLTLEGGGALKLRLSMKTKLVDYLYQIGLAVR
jgi:hypothetical protein